MGMFRRGSTDSYPPESFRAYKARSTNYYVPDDSEDPNVKSARLVPRKNDPYQYVTGSYSNPKKEEDVFSNPDPNNYTFVRVEKFNETCVIEMEYPDCTNYEGRKILVYNCPLEDIINQKLIDPHFSDNPNYISPFARFDPTEKGWEYALMVAKTMDKGD